MRALHKKSLHFKRLDPVAEAVMTAVWQNNKQTKEEIIRFTLELKDTKKDKIEKTIEYLIDKNYIKVVSRDRYVAITDEIIYKKYCKTYLFRHWEATGGIFDLMLTIFMNTFFSSRRIIPDEDIAEIVKIIEELYEL